MTQLFVIYPVYHAIFTSYFLQIADAMSIWKNIFGELGDNNEQSDDKNSVEIVYEQNKMLDPREMPKKLRTVNSELALAKESEKSYECNNRSPFCF